MKIIQAVLTYWRSSPLHWVTFDQDSGQMIDCSINPTNRARRIYEHKRYSIKGNKIIMKCDSDKTQERTIETITEINIYN